VAETGSVKTIVFFDPSIAAKTEKSISFQSTWAATKAPAMVASKITTLDFFLPMSSSLFFCLCFPPESCFDPCFLTYFFGCTTFLYLAVGAYGLVSLVVLLSAVLSFE